MYYEAQANISYRDINIKLNQPVTKEVLDKLPAKLKLKFKAVKEKADVHPKGFNEIIGDNPEEKAKRDQLAKEDEKKVQVQAQDQVQEKKKK